MWKIRMKKKDWYRHGGLANPDCIRRATKSGVWTYWVKVRA